MISCTGMCRTCGRCQGQAGSINKAAMLVFPADWKPDTGDPGLGAAIDLGTTTIAVTLWDRKDGSLLAGGSCANPQSEYGSDVISRVTFCGREEGNTRVLQRRAAESINRLMRELCHKAGCDMNEIERAAVCGNTVMTHIFSGFSPISLAKAPFLPQYQGSLTLSGRETGLAIHGAAKVEVLSGIAGHVGSDITAGLLAGRILEKDQLTLYIDIGTNGEIVLTDGKRTLACSTSAGPALEGASLKWGMKAAEGAIQRVRIQKECVSVGILGGGRPVGICGSGIIDAVAEMIRTRLVTTRGRIVPATAVPSVFRERIIEEGKSRSFALFVRDGEAPITVTQEDIRQIQLAKGAIQAGIRILLAEMKKSVEEIEKVIVAGAFGNHIDIKNAMVVGILPQVTEEKVFFAGNAAGAGTAMTLLSGRERERAKDIPGRVRHIELAGNKKFQKWYLEGMLF